MGKRTMIIFNVDSVREYLKLHGEVYTLRKPRKAFQRDIAIRGSYYKPTEIIGKVEIELAKANITDPDQLKPYLSKSGMTNCEEWFTLAKKLSGELLDLYYVRMIEVWKGEWNSE